MSAKARLTRTDVAGTLRVVARAPGRRPRDITWLRDQPTGLGRFSTTDPFGPEQGDLTLPGVTPWDEFGVGDLDWLVPFTNLDLVYDGPMPAGYPWSRWRWEGYVVSADPSSEGLRLSVLGALRQLDNYLAKPEYPARPIPYERAIARQWRHRPDLRITRPRVDWPEWWQTTYTAKKKAPGYMVPTGVSTGDNWTGMVTRQTGSWEEALSGYIQSLLLAMYTERGMWTLDLEPGRRTVLRHRDIRLEVDADTLVLDPVTPDLDVNLSVDWSQTVSAVFGQGTSLAGTTYSGMQVSVDGKRTFYEPLAALRQVHPTTPNVWHQPERMRKETNLQMQQGLDLADARKVGAAHLARFADPGVTGTVTLGTDPRLGGPDGPVCPRHLIRAGMTVHLPRLFGRPDGLLLHITQASHDFAAGRTTLTVDSKFRDALTVDEVRLRGRDALSVNRALIGGKYTPVVPDQLLPWSYAEGSGYIPSGKTHSARPLFRGMPDSITFPWEEWTTERPPKKSAWRSSYIRIGPAKADADKNWATMRDSAGANVGIPVKVAQAGQIRLVQIAAYDRHGHVMKVPFHVSLYYQRGVNVLSMPKIPAGREPKGTSYKAGQHYPFFRDAWESYNRDGTKIGTEVPVATESVGLLVGWGNHYEQAGYWPGSSGAGDEPTGLLVDEGQFSFDTTGQDSTFDPYQTEQESPYAGQLYIMIFCDQQGDEPVFFAGRMFRVEPGVSA